MLKYSLGIDISKNEFHACLSVIDHAQQVKVKATRKFSNQAEGFKAVQNWINKNRKEPDLPLTIVMEATGVYYEGCALHLFKAGYQVCVVLPNKANKYLQAIGLKTKNDQIDAIGLARMGAEQHLEVWQPLDDFFYTLRAFTRHYESLTVMKTQMGNQLHADQHSIYSNKEVIKQLKKLISTLDGQIEKTSREIHHHLYSQPDVAQKVKLLMEIKGLGVLSIATVLAETNGFVLFKKIPQLVSYAGYDVVENQSGGHRGKTRISKKGNSRIRRILYMPALVAIRCETGNIKAFFDRIIEKGNPKMKGYVAVQRKLLILIYTIWKKGEVYQPDKINSPGKTKAALDRQLLTN